MEPKYVHPTPFSKSPYTATHLKDRLVAAVNAGGFENGGVLAFVVSEDTQEVILKAVTKDDKDLPDVPVTDILSAYKEYLVRCVKKDGTMNVPATPDGMYQDIWNAFGATVVASYHTKTNAPDLQILSEILTKSYGVPTPILICKINFSVKNDTMKIWDIACATLLDFIPALEEDSEPSPE